MSAVTDPGASAAAADQRRRWSFGDAVLDGRSLRLYVGGRAVEIEMKPLEVLRHLLQHTGEAVSKDDLLKAVWPGRILSDSALTNTMAKLRDALGDDAQSIKTVHGFGYRLEADVRVSAGEAVPASAAESASGGAPKAAAHPAAGSPPRTARIAALAAAALSVGVGALWLFRGAESPAPVEKSIAVLPFANTSGDAASEYFSDGLSQEMISALGQLPGLRVIGRTSSFRFKNTDEDSRAIGEKLGVAYLLEGSVRKAADRVRIAVQLVKTADGAALWSETYDRDLEDIFAVQRDIAAEVAGTFRLAFQEGGGTLGHGQTDAPASGNVAAYEALLAGHFQRGMTPDVVRAAIVHYERAVALDPTYAAAYAHLSGALVFLADIDSRVRREERARLLAAAGAAADSALRLNPDLSLARSARAALLLMRMELAGATAEFERAVELAPQDLIAVMHLGVLRDVFGQFDEAIALLRRAVSLNPLAPVPYLDLSLALRGAGRYEEAEVELRKALELQPQGVMSHGLLAQLQILRGDAEAALATAEREVDPKLRAHSVALAHVARGDRAAADAALRRQIAEGAPLQVAEIYALRREPDAMFQWLERAVADRDPTTQRLLGNPFFAPYREDPRFTALARRIGVLPRGPES